MSTDLEKFTKKELISHIDFMNETLRSISFIVVRFNHHGPVTKLHPTMSDAQNEAQRLAKMYPGEHFLVAGVTKCYKGTVIVNESPIEVIPF